MNASAAKKIWLPYAVLVVGIIISFTLWFFLAHILREEFSNNTLSALKLYLPRLALIGGVTFALLLAAIIRIDQLAKQQALSLKHMNEDLKKEINERTNAEESKQKLEVALLQGQKLQAIGTLAGGIAHDFNNILYAIIGYVEIVREDTPKETLSYKNLGKVLEAAGRGRELISRILAFSRRQHHNFELINLKSTIEAVLALLRPTIPASVNITFKSQENLTIKGNQTQIHQVFVNIINNAVDAMDGEGTINITINFVPANDSYLKQFPKIQLQNYCKIEISDTGRGMNQQIKERIFDPFFTTKEVGKGTGLGLSIVHSIIMEHEGEITVSSQLGHGTTFTILLPTN